MTTKATKANLVFSLPWPPRELSPNARQHWAKLAKAKKAYRRTCWAEVLEQRAHLRGVVDGPLSLSLQFGPPDRRRYDRDNLLARMKSGIDGVCDALGIDDVRFVSVTVCDGAVTRGGAVWVRIEGAA